MISKSFNLDPVEIKKFESIAAQWWDQKGPCQPLHALNSCRFAFIQKRYNLTGKKVLDLGCGAGILTETLARSGAIATGLDAGERLITVAKSHAADNKLTIDYQAMPVEQYAMDNANAFDVITCMELLEHVPDIDALLRACVRLLKPGGHFFFSTLNRTAKAYLLAILGAEYVLNILPKKTHDFARFIRPSEIENVLRKKDVKMVELCGIFYNPFLNSAKFSVDISVNYLGHAIKEGC